MRTLTTSLAIAAILLPGSGTAAPILFFGEDIAPPDGSAANIPNAAAARASFDSFFAGNVAVEDFESYAPGGQLPRLRSRASEPSASSAAPARPGTTIHCSFASGRVTMTQ